MFVDRRLKTANVSTLEKQEDHWEQEWKNIEKKWTASQESLLEQTRPGQLVSATSLQLQIMFATRIMGERQGDWSRIRQSWQTYKGGNMDQEDGEHESWRGELPTEPHMGQAFTYWRPAPEVSPDEGFRREAETSINSMFLVVLE